MATSIRWTGISRAAAFAAVFLIVIGLGAYARAATWEETLQTARGQKDLWTTTVAIAMFLFD